MAGKTLYDKLWDAHVVRTEEDGTALIYIDRHLVHEVTSVSYTHLTLPTKRIV